MTKSKTSLQKVEIWLATLNHVFIGFCTFYSVWYCFKYGFDKPHVWHVFWCSLGFHFLLAEGIMAMYSGNPLTIFSKRRNKKRIHAILQAVGGTLGLIGFFWEIIERIPKGEAIWHIWHGRAGEKFFNFKGNISKIILCRHCRGNFPMFVDAFWLLCTVFKKSQNYQANFAEILSQSLWTDFICIWTCVNNNRLQHEKFCEVR